MLHFAPAPSPNGFNATEWVGRALLLSSAFCTVPLHSSGEREAVAHGRNPSGDSCESTAAW